MNDQLQLYLTLESIALQLDRTADPYADTIRDQMDPIWDELTETERAWLDSRGHLTGALELFETAARLPHPHTWSATPSTNHEPKRERLRDLFVQADPATSIVNPYPPEARKVA